MTWWMWLLPLLPLLLLLPVKVGIWWRQVLAAGNRSNLLAAECDTYCDMILNGTSVTPKLDLELAVFLLEVCGLPDGPYGRGRIDDLAWRIKRAHKHVWPLLESPKIWVGGIEAAKDIPPPRGDDGRGAGAHELFASMQHLRDPDGSYWRKRKEEGRAMTTTYLRLHSDDLLSKWGFNDGDIPDEVLDYCDERGIAPPGNWHPVLIRLVHTYLLPEVQANHPDLEVTEIATAHNPIRADGCNSYGTLVNWARGDFSPSYVDVAMGNVIEAMVRVILEQALEQHAGAPKQLEDK